MNINILYFASLADKAQKSQETLEVDAATNIADLYHLLQERYAFTLSAERMRVAINDEFGEWQDELKEGDTVAFIPPVAGG